MTDLPRPFLKWAGGKTRMLDEILPLLPPSIERYYEPFLGGGAVFFALHRAGRFESAHLMDVNEELVNCYAAIRDDVGAVVRALKRHAKNHSEEHYYAVRASKPRASATRAARTIYLNKTGFNGLHRVNSQGAFNVPFGKAKNPCILDEPNLRAVSEALQGVVLECAAFGGMLRVLEDESYRYCGRDAAYFDPPYMPLKKTSFVRYDRSTFGVEEHRLLVVVVKQLHGRGVNVVVSNSDCAETRELYEGCRIKEVRARRSINRDARGRGDVADLLIRP